MNSAKREPNKNKQEQLCVVCFSKRSSTGLQVVTSQELTLLERISGVKFGSKQTADKFCICLICKLSLKFSSKFIEMCKLSQTIRIKPIQMEEDMSIKLEPEFLDIKIVQSINDLLDWVEMVLEEHSQDSMSNQEDINEPKNSLPGSLENVKLEIKSEPVESIDTFNCSDCGVKCKTARILRNHRMKRHNINEKEQFICDRCGKEFNSKSRMIYHLNVHFSLKPFVCSYEDCKKTFNNPTGLRNHTNEFHLKLIRAYCPICNRGFRTKAARDLHVKGHGDPTIPCELCGKLFTTKKTLAQHKKIHENIKNFKCQFCDRAFIKKCTLETHIRSHTKETPYICPECNWGFAYNVALRKHRARVHQVDVKFYTKRSRTEPVLNGT